MIAVVGAGTAGLTAAWALARDGHEVVVFEAGERVGGQLYTLDLDGVPVDVGAESVHLGAPHVAQLVSDLGLLDAAVGSRPGASLLVTGRGLKPLPAGVGPTGPTKLGPVLRSGIMGPLALARAGLEPVLARRRQARDVSVGRFIRRRFGDTVAAEFVDPLLGNLHGGDIDRLSLHATAGQLRAAAVEGRSLTWKKKSPPGPVSKAPATKAPMFASWREGLRALPEALVARGGFELRLGTPVRSVRPEADHWIVQTDGQALEVAGVVFAAGAAATAGLLGDLLPASARTALEAIPHADVATVVLGYDRTDAAACGALHSANGLLVPSPRVQTMKAATFLSRKWPHLDDSEHYLLRASVGRAGDDLVARSSDDELVAGVVADLRRLIGLAADPALAQVVRWPAAMPQLVVGHLDRLETIRSGLDGLPPAAFAGGPFDGLGIVSTTKSGLQAAARLATVGR